MFTLGVSVKGNLDKASAALYFPGPGITNICLSKCTYAYFGAITYVVCKYMFFGKHKGHLRSTYAKK